MTITRAIQKWGYRARDQKRLEAVCRSAPERFVKKGRICIPEDQPPLYLPDRRFRLNGAVYVQLLNACVRRREVVPQSLGLSASEIYAYLEQMKAAGLILLHDEKQNTTLRYLPTMAGEEANSAVQRTKRVLKALEPALQPIKINVNTGG